MSSLVEKIAVCEQLSDLLSKPSYISTDKEQIDSLLFAKFGDYSEPVDDFWRALDSAVADTWLDLNADANPITAWQFNRCYGANSFFLTPISQREFYSVNGRRTSTKYLFDSTMFGILVTYKALTKLSKDYKGKELRYLEKTAGSFSYVLRYAVQRRVFELTYELPLDKSGLTKSQVEDLISLERALLDNCDVYVDDIDW